ncbi:hypothetical protein [Celeribacter arenosi]|uniref:Uncharacterized protein n=1 Tax=Celeribacter arenosi TaxID=792649 RepID=A0ABP7KFG6_9RHOB
MIHDLKSALTRSRSTLAEDMVGAVSLLVILIGGLSIPAIF